MARRGVMTALQAALAGIGGAAGGYVQMEERKRKQLEEERQRAQQDFLMRFNLAESGARPRQAPVPGAAPEAPGTPPKYQSIGTLGGVEYEAPTPEFKAAQARTARAADIETEMTARSEAETKRWQTALPDVTAALEKIEPRYLPPGIRSMILAGGFGTDPAKAVQAAFEIANQNRATDIAASRAQSGGQTVADIRKAINDKVAQFRSNVMQMTKDMPDPERMNRTIKVRLTPEEQKKMIADYRSGLEADYGLRSAAPPPTTDGGGFRMSFGAPAAGARPNNVGTILDRMTAFGAEGPTSPMTWQSSSGKTYQFK